MSRYVIDTQALVKFLNGQKVINNEIERILQQADLGEHLIFIPSAVIFEIGYLHEKGRIPIAISDIQQLLEDSINYAEERLSIDIIQCAFQIADIPELHDRLIAGTARYLDIPLITNDPVILNSKFVNCA